MSLCGAVTHLRVEEVWELEEQVWDARLPKGAPAGGFGGGGGFEEAGEPGGDEVMGVVLEELGVAAAVGGAGGER